MVDPDSPDEVLELARIIAEDDRELLERLARY